MIQTRIRNAQNGSEEYFKAQEDLFALLKEKADHAKQTAEDTYAKIQESLDKIGETMKSRVAEEAKTAKGDTYFIDVGNTRNAQAQLDNLMAAVKTNDPKAVQMLADFKKKMMGIN